MSKIIKFPSGLVDSIEVQKITLGADYEPKNHNDAANKQYVDKRATGTVKYLGTVSVLSDLSTTASDGDFYRVSTQFTFGSETAHVGDILIATKDNPTQNIADWDLIHTEVDSDTWVANTATADGYVTKTNGAANNVWKTNESGVPSWQADNTETWTFTLEDGSTLSKVVHVG